VKKPNKEIEPLSSFRKIINTLAAGKYASEWYYEITLAYRATLAAEGKEKADQWLWRELRATVPQAVAARRFHMIQVLSSAWDRTRTVIRILWKWLVLCLGGDNSLS
jgi:hypothetical protein